MSVRKIYTQGDEVLSKKAHPVTNFDQKLHALLDDMRDTLIHADGAGLAAPQIGILRRVAVISDGEVITELVNPEIVSIKGEQNGFEGCLSVPEKYGMVKRPMTVTVKAQDRNGNEFTMTGEEIVARAFCHEIDHLNGVLFTKYTSRLFTPEELQQMSKEEA
ncbi:MAG: peptide deformylase [Oscillospiraceae bacterium]